MPEVVEHVPCGIEREPPAAIEPPRDLGHDPPVRARLARRLRGLVVLDDAAFGVRGRSLVLGPRRRREDDVGALGRLGQEEVGLRVELQGLVAAFHRREVRQRHEGVVAQADHPADLATLHLPDHLDERGPRMRQLGLVDPPGLADRRAVLRILEVAHPRQHVRLLAVFTPPLAVPLAGDRPVAGPGAPDLTGRENEVDHRQAVVHAL